MLLHTGCSRPPEPPSTTPAAAGPATNTEAVSEAASSPADAPSDAYAAFAAVEARLLAAPQIDLRFHVESTGAFASALEGQLQLEPAQAAALQAKGTFGPEPAEVQLTADAEQFVHRSGSTAAARTPRPSDLEGSVLVGLTRMGILHNLARLVAGQPPDHADGTVDQWVQVGNVQWSDSAPIDGRPARALQFSITVAGQPSGEATLWIDQASGLPGRREQTVHFGADTMHVIEVYDWIEPAP